MHKLDAGELRRLVRRHLERLSEDLAGAGLDAAEVESMVRRELAALLKRRRTR